MADDHKKAQGLDAPVHNPYAAAAQQNSPAWQQILASAAAGMAGQPNPVMQQMQAQHAQQAQALQAAKNAQAAQLANYQNTAQAHMQDPAVQRAAIQHAGPAPGGLAGNPLAPSAQQQVQQMGAQGAQAMTPDELRRQQPLTMAAAAPPVVAMSDERIKDNVDRAGIDREFRRFFDSIGSQASAPRRKPAHNVDSLAGRAMRRG